MRDWLKRIRIQEGFTQEKIADILCISRAHYTRIEIGQRNPSIKIAKQISKLLNFNKHGISWTVFYDFKNEKRLI